MANHAIAHTNGEQSKCESLGRQLFGEQSHELLICELFGGQLKCKNAGGLFILDELGRLSNKVWYETEWQIENGPAGLVVRWSGKVLGVFNLSPGIRKEELYFALCVV
ncbi:hypothetical protein J1N35_023401 [Gossypium stocksii]|uniref:Uncharacterized protein n=1 Tax=Gossypium stocksii TaxID=47602 RepID=A0A9D3VI14_9ROSI|nr:hypothetical protein J1N35_023401 [Gossypium stocksii]